MFGYSFVFCYSTAKKAKEFEKMLQIYEVNRNNINQSLNGFMEQSASADAKELELTELRDQLSASNDQGYLIF